MPRTVSLSSFLVGVSISIIVILSALGGALADRIFVIRPLEKFFPRQTTMQGDNQVQKGEVLSPLLSTTSENIVVEVAERSKTSFVTVSATRKVRAPSSQFGLPFQMFFELPSQQKTEEINQDIGSGFVVSQDDGLVVTNRHVVSDAEATYTVIDSEGKSHAVTNIYRDPVNDLAILQTDARLPALPLADSDQIKVGESVIAIGTALGEFRQTVTTGIVSGLGRGITASDGFTSTERIDNLIQTDAAINPGNSGGPLLNIRGEVIGVNVAMAAAENIGFAIPINVVKSSIENFNQTGRFDRPMLGVRYKVIPQETALLNDVPEGAYIIEVIPKSTADSLGVEVGDIITKIDGRSISQIEGNVAGGINQKKVGDTLTLEVWRDGQIQTLSGQLQSMSASE
jgi:serine protease Do